MTRCPVRFHGVAASDHSDGESGNPQGWPEGSKNRLATEFLDALAEDFAAHGREALRAMREICAS